MKYFVGLVVVMFVLLRVWAWNQKLTFTEGVCGRLAAGTLRDKSSQLLKVKGQPHSTLQGQIELIDPSFFYQGKWWAITGSVSVPWMNPNRIPVSSWLVAEGSFDCTVPFKNFSAQENGLFARGSHRFTLRKGAVWELEGTHHSLSFKIRSAFHNYLKEMLRPFPWLGGVVWAVWTGEVSGLDLRLVELYRAGGLLPLIALSGQHVSVLVVMVKSVFVFTPNLLMEQRWFRRGFRFLLFFLPVFMCSILTLTSFSAPSVLRTLAMTLAVCLLRMRKKHCSTVQLLCSSAAFLIILDPSLISGISFVLSLGGTFLLLQIEENKKCEGPVRSYVSSCLLMPILSAPLILFYFSQWGYLSPFCTLVLSWLWNLVIIPIGFIIPLTGLLPNFIAGHILKSLNWGWRHLVEYQLIAETWVRASQSVYLRPSVLEMAVFEMSCLLLVKQILRGLNGDLLRRSRINALGFDFFRQKVSN